MNNGPKTRTMGIRFRGADECNRVDIVAVTKKDALLGECVGRLSLPGSGGLIARDGDDSRVCWSNNRFDLMVRHAERQGPCK